MGEAKLQLTKYIITKKTSIKIREGTMAGATRELSTVLR